MLYVGIKGKTEFVPSYLGSGRAFKKALKQFGKAAFKIRVLAWADSKSELSVMEKKIIARYREKFGRDALYNLADGGYQGRGWKHSEETLTKMSNAQKNIVKTPEWKARIAATLTGRKQDADLIRRRTQHQIGRPLSVEAKEKMRQTRIRLGIGRGVPLSVEHRMNIKEGIRRARMVAAV